MQCAIGTRLWAAADAVGTTYSHSVGFRPQLGIVFWSGQNSATTTTSTGQHKRAGFAVFRNVGGTLERWCVGSIARDGNTTMNTSREKRTDAIAVTHDPTNTTPTLEGLLDIDVVANWPSDGFQFIVDDQGAADLQISWLVWGGDVAEADCFEFTEPGAIGTQQITTPGFSPDLVILAGIMHTADGNSGPQAHSNMFVGMFTKAGEQMVRLGGSEDAVGTAIARRYINDIECVAHMDLTTQNLNGRAEFSQMLSNGFELNWLEVDGNANRRIFAIAIKGGKYAIQAFNASTTVNETFTVTYGFQPRGVLTLATTAAEDAADTLRTHDVIAIGAGVSPTERVSQGVMDENGTSSGDVTTQIAYEAVACGMGTLAGAVDYLIDIDAILADGARFINDNAPIGTTFVGTLGIGDGGSLPYQPKPLLALIGR